MKLLPILMICAPLCVAQCYADSSAQRPTVTIESGALMGTWIGSVETFEGIPYAAPPVGALRWEPPAPFRGWSGIRDAANFGAICPQPVRSEERIGDQPQSEDCLFLNVWTFAGAKRAPVMVWIHGGSFRFGAGSVRLYNGSDFARDGVILVTINYRLGALGFFAHPALTKAAPPDAPLANYGILDQLAALRWVQRNIAAFGGDPDNLTVAGESAGATSVLTLLSLPAAKGLFARAVVESGKGWEQGRTLADAEKSGIALAESAGLGAAATAEQLRALPPDKLFNEPLKFGEVGPVVDGRLIKQSTTRTFASGNFIHVPVIIGSNSYEASLMQTFHIPASDVIAHIPDAVRSLYPGPEDTAAEAFFTDSVIGAPARWIATQVSRDAPAWLYYFSYVPTRRRGTAPGAQHASEIPFVFAGWPDIFNRFASPEDRAMEALMHSCWVAFAKAGKPECGDKPWPAYTPPTAELKVFGINPGVETGFRKAQYDALQHAILPRLIGDAP